MDKANAVEIDDPQETPEPDQDKQEAHGQWCVHPLQEGDGAYTTFFFS